MSNGKGDKRRKGENTAAVRRNWPFPDKELTDAICTARDMLNAQPVPALMIWRCPKCGGPTEQWEQEGRPTPAIRCINRGCTWWL